MIFSHSFFAPLSARARFLGEVILPPLCLLCSARIMDNFSLCGACWNTLSLIDSPLRERSGLPLAHDMGDGGVFEDDIHGLADVAWGRVRGSVLYNESGRRLVHGLKYYDRHENALFMGRLMARVGADLLADADIILPVPLHWTRLWSRRYNQSALLSSVLSDLSGCALDMQALFRMRRTRTQIGLGISARRHNMRGAFAISATGRHYIEGRRVLLVDDVLTTGATLDACVRTVLASGASSVDGLVFALTPDASVEMM